MKVSINYDQKEAANLLSFEMSEATKQDSVESLKARIAELELALKNHMKTAEKADKLLKAMWGDDFNGESLH